MRISFFGAAREVTGSCFLVETEGTRLLVDCGMFQGGRLNEPKNAEAFAFDPSTVDAVLVTHAHLDHTGRLPKLVREGFRGRIYATPPTVKLAQLVVEDAAQIMQEDAERDGTPVLYSPEDMEKAFNIMQPLDYSRWLTIGDLSFRFRDAGHIFGSAFIELREREGAHVAFSGDLGNTRVPILRETAQLAETDVLVMESTYGNRIHEDESTRRTMLHDAIVGTIKRNGILIIPAFAIERTQQVLYEMNRLVENGLIPRVQVFLDSPMAIKASHIIKGFPEYFDAEALRLVSSGDDLFTFQGLRETLSREESKTINAEPRPKVIIAGSGMMNGGRILHHLVRYLGDDRSTVLIIGYQAEGTLGRKLYEGAKSVTVLGQHIEVEAQIKSIGAYSAHADQNKLVGWVSSAARIPKRVYCVHGDEGASVALATRLHNELGIEADVPRIGESVGV